MPITHDKAAPTSDMCLTAPNSSINIILCQLQEIITYLERRRKHLVGQTTPLRDEEASQHRRIVTRTASTAHLIFMRPPEANTQSFTVLSVP